MHASKEYESGLCCAAPKQAPALATEHVAPIAAFIGAIYPGQGLESSLTAEHIARFNVTDYTRVWDVRAPPAVLSMRGLMWPRMPDKRHACSEKRPSGWLDWSPCSPPLP
jgi:hypothetical protein